MRDLVGPEKGEYLCWEARPVRGFWNGLKGQVDAFKAKMGRTVQTEFEEDFIFRTDTQRLMGQDLEERILET